MRSTLHLPALAACLTLSAAAADLSAPLLGLAGSRSGAVHPILGLPGAALVGDALDLGFAASSAAVSPRQDYVLAVDSETGLPRLAVLRRGSVSVTDLPGATRRPARLLLSPAGSAAALVDGDTGRVQIFAGLPDSAVLRHEVAAAAFTFAALSDDGDLLLTGSDSGVQLFAGDAAPAALPFPVTIHSAAFRSGSHDAVFAGAALFRIRDLNAGSAIPEAVALPAGEAAPTAAALDGERALLAYANGSLALIDLATGAAAQTSCNCTPGGLDRLGSGSLFRLTDISDRPVMLVDAAGPAPQVWFVPAQRSAR